MSDRFRLEGQLLGQRVPIPQSYAPEILVRVPRLSIIEKDPRRDSPDYAGCDVWHAYEVGAVQENGIPCICVLKIVYSAHSRYIVESKSLKLYLFSLTGVRFPGDRYTALRQLSVRVAKDLSHLLETEVRCEPIIARGDADDFRHYSLLESVVDMRMRSEDHLDLSFRPETLELYEYHEPMPVKWRCDLLRSNCPVTGQPDWGSLFVSLMGGRLPHEESLLQYIVAMREEQHFHEEICEILYNRLLQDCQPDQLMVCCLYTRRGGIDICPTRATSTDLLPSALIDPHILTHLPLRQ